MALINDRTRDHRSPATGMKSPNKKKAKESTLDSEYISKTKVYLQHMDKQDIKTFVNTYATLGLNVDISKSALKHQNSNENLFKKHEGHFSAANLHPIAKSPNKKNKKRYVEEDKGISWNDSFSNTQLKNTSITAKSEMKSHGRNSPSRKLSKTKQSEGNKFQVSERRKIIRPIQEVK